MMPSGRIAVCLEVTPKQALASYAGRYAPVAADAGLSFPAAVAFGVAERVPGGPATAFAAPECRRPFP